MNLFNNFIIKAKWYPKCNSTQIHNQPSNQFRIIFILFETIYRTVSNRKIKEWKDIFRNYLNLGIPKIDFHSSKLLSAIPKIPLIFKTSPKQFSRENNFWKIPVILGIPKIVPTFQKLLSRENGFGKVSISTWILEFQKSFSQQPFFLINFIIL